MKQLDSIFVVAENYAVDSTNKMHSDDVAKDYGFSGGLVPGVGVYSYMTIPLVHALGEGWIRRGCMWGKFLKPVYDGETVCVSASIVSENPTVIEIAVKNSDDQLLAVGKAVSEPDRDPPNILAYPETELPQLSDRVAGRIDHLPADARLGSLVIPYNAATYAGESGRLFADEMVDPHGLYRGDSAVCHPAFYPAMANRILVENVDLGPWIHTESDVEHYDLPGRDEVIQVRAQVEESFEKRGHEFVILDAAFFGGDDRPLAHVRHTAIVHPALVTR